MAQKKNPNLKEIIFRLPSYLADELVDMAYLLKKRSPDYKWSQNKIVCEAIRVWLIGAKKQLGDKSK